MMSPKEIDDLIRYHQAGLDQYRFQMSPSSQVLEEKTIQALKDLKGLKEVFAADAELFASGDKEK